MTSDYPIPPDKLNEYIGGGKFKKIGQKWFRQFLKLGNLQPTDKVLDVGCGAGRMAVPMIPYLTKGSYEGFDLSEDAIKWCKENIEAKNPNFHFRLIDLYHKEYNMNGKIKASDFNFPFESETFDFIFLTSVFTHMLPVDMEQYLFEISRILKINKKCFISFFLLNSDSIKNMENGTTDIDFKFNSDGYRTTSKDAPELALAYKEDIIRNLFKKWRSYYRKNY